MSVRPLIEQWFPASTIGAESVRGRATFTALPSAQRSHVWWKRVGPRSEPSSGVVASLLPAWPTEDEAADDIDSNEVRTALMVEFPKERGGVPAVGCDCEPSGFSVIRSKDADASTRPRSPVGSWLTAATGTDVLSPVRPMPWSWNNCNEWFASALTASDPRSFLTPLPVVVRSRFEAARFGCQTIANELNPVAAAVLNATVDPARVAGPELRRRYSALGD